MNTKVNQNSDYLSTVQSYYTNCFPYQLVYDWLSYGDPVFGEHREFAFTRPNNIWIRYCSFKNWESLRAMVLSRRPDKINIGAVYSKPPSSCRADEDFTPLARELVFDLDLSDYNDVRSCCGAAQICKKCWKFVQIAMKVLKKILQDYCGFKHILWVFSGRRGIHAWVCDEEVHTMPKFIRQSVIDSFNIFIGNAGRRVILDAAPYHPIISMSLKVIQSHFIPLCIEDQNMMMNEEIVEQVLKFVPMELRDDLKKRLLNLTNSSDRWQRFVDYVTQYILMDDQWIEYHNCVDEIMLQWCFPRLDADVTTGMKHLLKSPYSVHPETGKIAIPINPLLFDKFDPLTAPCIYSVAEEARKYDEQCQMKRPNFHINTEYWNKTSVGDSINVFYHFLYSMEFDRLSRD